MAHSTPSASPGFSVRTAGQRLEHRRCVTSVCSLISAGSGRIFASSPRSSVAITKANCCTVARIENSGDAIWSTPARRTEMQAASHPAVPIAGLSPDGVQFSLTSNVALGADRDIQTLFVHRQAERLRAGSGGGRAQLPATAEVERFGREAGDIVQLQFDAEAIELTRALDVPGMQYSRSSTLAAHDLVVECLSQSIGGANGSFSFMRVNKQLDQRKEIDRAVRLRIR